MSRYLLAGVAAGDRVHERRRTTVRSGVRQAAMPPTLATVLYVASALRARPREIDHYIDYFGDQVPQQR